MSCEQPRSFSVRSQLGDTLQLATLARRSCRRGSTTATGARPARRGDETRRIPGRACRSCIDRSHYALRGHAPPGCRRPCDPAVWLASPGTELASRARRVPDELAPCFAPLSRGVEEVCCRAPPSTTRCTPGAAFTAPRLFRRWSCFGCCPPRSEPATVRAACVLGRGFLEVSLCAPLSRCGFGWLRPLRFRWGLRTSDCRSPRRSLPQHRSARGSRSAAASARPAPLRENRPRPTGPPAKPKPQPPLLWLCARSRRVSSAGPSEAMRSVHVL